jgi:hypothetical protein
MMPIPSDMRQDIDSGWSAATDPYPADETKWARRFTWLRSSYLGTAYESVDHRALSLFRAEDEAGNDIAVTDRIIRDVQHVVNVDKHAIAKPLSLEARRDAGRVEEGEGVWRRSRMQQHLGEWALNYCMLGEVVLEASVDPTTGKSRIYAHNPAHCMTEYTPDGTRLLKLTVITSTIGVDNMLRKHHRVLTEDAFESWEEDPRSETGRRDYVRTPHSLGVVPAVHPKFEAFGSPHHGLSAQHALARPIGSVDSLIAQIGAITKRSASPILEISGIPTGQAWIQKLGLLGRVLELGTGKRDSIQPQARYVEPVFGAIASTWQMTRELLAETRATVPEFLFAGSGANTSGYALDLRADAWRLKAEGFRGSFYDALAEVTQLAAMLDDRAAFDLDDSWYRIKAPPVLPIDKGRHIQIITSADAMGALREVDKVRALQALDVVDPEIDADAYVALLKAETSPSDAGDNLGKIPLALQQLALARERAITAGDQPRADKIGQKIEELTELVTSDPPAG